MSLIMRIEKDYLSAYKAKNQLLLDVLRLLKTAAKNLQVELMRPITDEEFLSIIQKQAKQRQDSIKQFSVAQRFDLVDKESAELEILKEYLPKQLSSEEIQDVITQTIKKLNASSMSDMGKVIQSVMTEYKGRVDGKTVSDIVKSCLQ